MSRAQLSLMIFSLTDSQLKIVNIFLVFISKFKLRNDKPLVFFNQISVSFYFKSHIGFWSHSGELQIIPKIADKDFVMFAFK